MSRKGTAAFIALRASAVLLLPPVVWFLWSAVAHAGASYAEMRDWIAAPRNALMMGALIVVGAFHMRIGMNEIIDDYAHGGLRGVWKFINFLVCLGAGLLGLWSLYVLSL